MCGAGSAQATQRMGTTVDRGVGQTVQREPSLFAADWTEQNWNRRTAPGDRDVGVEPERTDGDRNASKIPPVGQIGDTISIQPN